VLVAACGPSLSPAIVTSELADKKAPKALTHSQAECIATAVVSVYGVAAFTRAGYTPANLRPSSSDLHRLPDPTEGQVEGMQQRLQRCRVGAVLAPELAGQFAATVTPAGSACLANKIDSDPATGRFVALALLNRNPDEPAAAALTNVLVECVDLAREALAQSGLKLTAAEVRCIDPKLSASAKFRQLIVDSLQGHSATDAEYIAAVAPALGACLSPQRIAQLGVPATTTTG
jgi:hypothetical protein